MGGVLHYCSGVDEEAEERLKQMEKENRTLKNKLIETQQAYNHLQDTVDKEVRFKIDKLYTDKTKTTQELVIEKQEKKILAQKYSTTRRKMTEIEDSATELRKENEELREKIASRSYSYSEPLSTEHDSLSTASDDEKDATPRTDIVKIRNWLVFKSLPEKDLKIELSKLLASRNDTHRIAIPQAYKQRYGSVLMEDISKIIKKGNVLEIISGLFKSKATFDACCIHDIITNQSAIHKAAVYEVAEIVCCRSIQQLELICNEYNKLYSSDMKVKISKLSSRRSYQYIINEMFNFSRNEHKTTNKIKIAAKVAGDITYLRDINLKWKQDNNKRRLAMMILGNNKNYVYDLSQMYFKESGNNLVDFVDQKLGEKSITAYWMKLRIEYCCDASDFYARKIQIMGDERWNAAGAYKINRIFVSTFDTQLKGIQERFDTLNYGNGKKMIEWLEKKCSNERYRYILVKMLQNARKKS